MRNNNNKKQILVVVDYQGDFVNGVLPVPEAETLAPNIQREIDNPIYEHTVYTFDTHTEEDYKTSEEREIFPDIHCEFKTVGWKLFEIKPKQKRLFKALLKKADKPFEIVTINNESFFCKDKFDIFEGNSIYPNWIEKSFNPEVYDVVITGVALNYCDFLHIMGLIKRDYTVIVKNDCVKGITNLPDGSIDPSFEANLEIMKKAGVIFE